MMVTMVTIMVMVIKDDCGVERVIAMSMVEIRLKHSFVCDVVVLIAMAATMAMLFACAYGWS